MVRERDSQTDGSGTASRRDALELVRAFLPPRIDGWGDALVGLPEADARSLLGEIYSAWLTEQIEPADFPYLGPDEPLAFTRELGRMFRDLPARWRDELWHLSPAQSELAVRRWCWAPGWELDSMDEDLLLMKEELIPSLLEEAGADCTKRRYVLAIVEHLARDVAHHAVWAEPAHLIATLRRIATWLPLARAARANELADYLARLASYAEPMHVDRATLEQRVLDLRRCYAARHVPIEVKRDQRRWLARLDRGNIRQGLLIVDADSGQMWAVES
jgi:hypothetical protein